MLRACMQSVLWSLYDDFDGYLNARNISIKLPPKIVPPIHTCISLASFSCEIILFFEENNNNNNNNILQKYMLRLIMEMGLGV